jgi:hypothetical protein
MKLVYLACITTLLFAFASANWFSSKPKVTSIIVADEKIPCVTKFSLKDYSLKDFSLKEAVGGLSLTLKDSFELKFGDYVVGVRNVLNNLMDSDVSNLRCLFLKTTYDLPMKYKGDAFVMVGYEPGSKVLSVDSEWMNKKENILLSLSWNSTNKHLFTEFGASILSDLKDMEFLISSKLKPIEKRLEGKLRLTGDKSALQLDYDNIEQDPKLRVFYKTTDLNMIEPDISLKTGLMSYTYTRMWNNSSAKISYQPEKNLLTMVGKSKVPDMESTFEIDMSTKDYSTPKFKYSPVFKF